MNLPFRQQENEWDCSMACIYMLFQYYHPNKINYFQFIQENNYFQDLNLLQMQQTADKYGVFLSAYFVKWKDFQQHQIQKPLICQIQKQNKFHFIVIYAKNKKSFLVADPLNDKLEWVKHDILQKMYTGVVLSSEKTIWWKKEYNANPSIFIFWNNLWFSLLLITIMGVFITACTIAIQFLIKMLIDDFLVKGIKELLTVIILGLSLLYIQKLILKFTFNLAINHIEKKFKKTWNLKFINHLKKLSYLDYQKYQTQNIIQNYHYFNEILHFHFPISLEIIKSLLIFFSSLVIIIIIDMNILLPILLLTSLLFLVYFALHPWILAHEKIIINQEKKWQNHLLNFCQNYLSYKNRNLIGWHGHVLFQSIEKQFTVLQKDNNWSNVQLIISEIFAGVKTIVILYLLLSNTNQNWKPGIFIFFFALINNLISQSQSLYQHFWYGIKIKNYKQRVYPFLFTQEKENLISLKMKIEKIILKKCNISLDGLENIWKNNLNLSIKQNLVVCGLSGVGKTIFLQMLNNYWKKYSGQIIINEEKLNKIESLNYEKEVYLLESYAPIWNGTVFENITAYEKKTKIWEIWQKLNVNYFLQLIQLNATSEINNQNISNGQRQMINFLALFFRNESLLLLDESLNSIPWKWKKELLQKLLTFQKDKIICYATHDPNIVVLFGQKLTLEKNEL